MLPYKSLIKIDRKGRQPIYLQVANRFISLIRDGLIRPGAYLPGSRILAEMLVLHRKTVVAAYDELASQDWVVPVPRKGMMVATNLPQIKPRTFAGAQHAYGQDPPFTLNPVPELPHPRTAGKRQKLVVNDGFPDVRLAPLDEWIRECRSLIQQPSYHRYLTTTTPSGNDHLRAQLVRHLSATRGLNIIPENTMITRGAQMSIYLAAALLISKGDHVIVGSPNYYFADLTFEQLGANLLRVPVDKDGIDVDAVEQLCKKKKIKLLYVISHHHHPTTVTLSAERRMKLLEIIRKYNLAVIEDDYDYDFYYSAAPIVPLASADHGGNVIYVGSFTKSLGLSLRIGFMIAPEKFMQQAAALRRLMDLGGDNLVEEALANMLKDGTIGRHLKKANKVYRERRDIAGDLLQKQLGDYVSFQLPQGGMAIWLQVDPKLKIQRLVEEVAGMGLTLNYSYQYYYGTKPGNAIRFGFAALNQRELGQAVTIIRKGIGRL
ncbi:GntR family transcriptional regulator / MocR family aminotransferase [Chitinophaga jiangningensis]|uniref:GntR family transcriptional regulator / MocR family aminotransferase n=1 Tax=Chitinophaga jiangningensis TaxID=1419482 RepID=A0A1M7AMD9_9BACT|nr:PLP-dependent aminotransferase family protein [Chitinophaga jiangningensis]SHL43835.1 GntR family transcriptional regulator / MocR family aminotransferase [Chitinophaga jiangningensis]